MDDDDFKKHEGGGDRHEGESRTSPYPVSRLAPPISLVDAARQIEQADQMVGNRVSSKLKVIADQIRALQEEARSVLNEAERDQDLHHVRCNFKRQPGKIYHLYQKEDGSRYFSMLSPEEWRGQPPHEFLGSFRLEADYSWTPAERLDETDDSHELVQRLLSDKGLPKP